MKNALTLGKVAGIKIYIHWTFSFLIAWVVLANRHAGLSWLATAWMVGFTLTVFCCILLHELGHALAAKRYNIITDSITLLPIGGLAQLESIPEEPKQELLIALAGPAVNFVIALALLPFISIHHVVNPEHLSNLTPSNFPFFLAMVNIWLGVFNLLPAFPMDGGRVLRAIISFFTSHSKATQIATAIRQVFGAIFFFAGFLYSPTLIVIGVFIFISGQHESNVARITDFLHGYYVRDAAINEIPTIENSTSVREAARILLTTQNKTFVVTDSGKPVGSITREDIARAMMEIDPNETIDHVKNSAVAYVAETTPLDEAWKIMQKDKCHLVLVGKNEEATGILEDENIAELMLFNPSGTRRK